jgi:hypothetical protein
MCSLAEKQSLGSCPYWCPLFACPDEGRLRSSSVGATPDYSLAPASFDLRICGHLSFPRQQTPVESTLRCDISFPIYAGKGIAAERSSFASNQERREFDRILGRDPARGSQESRKRDFGMGSMAGDVAKVSALSLSLAQSQLSTLIQASDTIDSKVSAILAFDGGLVAALLAAQSIFATWWAPALCLLVSALACAIALVGRTYDLGPDPATFYSTFGGATEAEANVAMLSEMELSLVRNDSVVHRKGQLLLLAITTTLASFLVAGAFLRYG